jgi:hypothetical protein
MNILNFIIPKMNVNLNNEINCFGNDWGLFVDLENIKSNNPHDNYERMLKKYNIKIDDFNNNNNNKNKIIDTFKYKNGIKTEDKKLFRIYDNMNYITINCFKKTAILGFSFAISYGIYILLVI